MANLRMLIDWCSYEVAEPYFISALPMIQKENKSLTNKSLHIIFHFQRLFDSGTFLQKPV